MIYTWNVQIDDLFHLPFSDLRSDQYSLSRCEIKLKITANDRVFIATPWQFVRLQIGEQEMKEGIKLHISHIDYVTIQSELKYLIAARNVDFWGAGFVWKPVATVRNRTSHLDPLLTLLTVSPFVSGDAEVSRNPVNLSCDAVGEECLRSLIDPPR